MAVLLSLSSMTSTTIDNDKNDKYDLLSIGNASTSASKAVDLFGAALQDRLPPSRKKDSNWTALQVSGLSGSIQKSDFVAEIAGWLFTGSNV